jgi:hypothetical protein
MTVMARIGNTLVISHLSIKYGNEAPGFFPYMELCVFTVVGFLPETNTDTIQLSCSAVSQQTRKKAAEHAEGRESKCILLSFQTSEEKLAVDDRARRVYWSSWWIGREVWHGRKGIQVFLLFCCYQDIHISHP